MIAGIDIGGTKIAIGLAGPAAMVVVMEGDPNLRSLNLKPMHDVRARGGRAELIGFSTENDALRLPNELSHLLPVVEILPIQMLTLSMAANRGAEAGRFVHVRKVTTEE